jgi:hypothetical protein
MEPESYDTFLYQLNVLFVEKTSQNLMCENAKCMIVSRDLAMAGRTIAAVLLIGRQESGQEILRTKIWLTVPFAESIFTRKTAMMKVGRPKYCNQSNLCDEQS